jgi:glycosyltransferase involved in cell wall biosynthesis
MSSPSFSVVICVYTEDRWERIIAAIDSVRAQTLPCAETIIVVDHNPALYKRLLSAAPDATVLENREAVGLSGGRNTGAAVARGDIVAFLDDDAVANPDVKGVGGMTVPVWESARPLWMPEEFYWVVGCNYRGLPPSGAPVRNLLGANMSFRREMFGLVDGFQTGIGRSSSKRPLGGEETEFCIRLTQRCPGSLLVMEHRARVWHYVPDGRSRFSYFLSRCYAEGLSKAQVTASVGRGDGLSSEHPYTTRTLPLGVARGIADLFRGDPTGLRRAGAIVAGLSVTTAGYLRATLEREPRPRPT